MPDEPILRAAATASSVTINSKAVDLMDLDSRGIAHHE